ncbi:MAG: tRNA A-37 threonylcarbamoyl transferase component Bud32 [Myxococcota bacterium]
MRYPGTASSVWGVRVGREGVVAGMRQPTHAAHVGRLRDRGTDDGAVVGLPDDPERRFQRETEVRYARSLAVYLMAIAVALPVTGVIELRGLAGGGIHPLVVIAARFGAGAVIGAIGYSLARRKGDVAPSRVLGADILSHVVVGTSLGALTALGDSWDRIVYLLVLSTLIFARALLVRGGWREATGAAVAAWVTALGTVVVLQLQGIVVGHDGARFALVQAVLATNVVIAIYGARRLQDLQFLETRARSAGRYQISVRLGGGASGDVYRAYDHHLARPCAIKVLRLHARDRVETLDRFEDEVRMTSQLGSPNVVRVYDFGMTQDARPYFVMELIDGVTLDTVVRRDGPMDVFRVLSLGRQCAVALVQAHARGVIHCDLKPSNLFAVGDLPDERLKIVDFGFGAFGAPARARQRVVSGTAGYIAPERLQGGGETPMVDVYGLGAVLYFLLTGYEAFVGDDPMEIAQSQLRETPPRPSLLRAEVPELCDRLVMRCLEPDPRKRYQTMREVREFIRQVEEELR